MILYWCQETALVPFETGIQRVVRRLAERLNTTSATIVPIGWDGRSRQVVSLPTPSNSRARPLESLITDAAILFVPEIPISLIGIDLDPIQLGRAYGLRTAALIHDLIPIKLAANYDAGGLAVFRRYYRQFASADLVLATTNYVAADLKDFLLREHLRVPPIEVVPLPAEFPSVKRSMAFPALRGAGDPLQLLAVTSWEPRKNLLRLLRAIQRASSDGGPRITLDLVGRQAGFPAYDAEVVSIVQTLPTVTIRGTVSDADLVSLYANCHVSVYPSVEEGFGLPILESLWLGRPCLCHNGSSMAEIAPGGGTVIIDMTDEDAIVDALRHLAATPDYIEQLAREAVARPLKDWAGFADDVLQRIAPSTMSVA